MRKATLSRNISFIAVVLRNRILTVMQSANKDSLRTVVEGHDQNKGMEKKGMPKARIRDTSKRTDSRGSEIAQYCANLASSCRKGTFSSRNYIDFEFRHTISLCTGSLLSFNIYCRHYPSEFCSFVPFVSICSNSRCCRSLSAALSAA
jgi:hypothetical protein